MAEVVAKIGFVSGGSSSMPHYNSFTPMIPKDVEFDFQGLDLYGKSLYEISDKKTVILKCIQEFVETRHWDGLLVSGAPNEVLNPGLHEDLAASLQIPFATALHACVAALKTYSMPRVLLLTPFDARMNGLIVDHLRNAGITAISPNAFEELGVPKSMTPDEVFALTEKNLSSAGSIDAIYFQGAVLDPIKCLERIETQLGKTVIASNPAMLWYILSRLGRRYPMHGYGKLIREWPELG